MTCPIWINGIAYLPAFESERLAAELAAVQGIADARMTRIDELEAALRDIRQSIWTDKHGIQRIDTGCISEALASVDLPLETNSVPVSSKSASAAETRPVSPTAQHASECPLLYGGECDCGPTPLETPVQVVCPCGFDSCNRNRLKPNEYCWRDRQAAGLAQETSVDPPVLHEEDCPALQGGACTCVN